MPRRLPAENESSSKPEENRSLLKSVSARYWGKITSSLGFGNRNTGDSVVRVEETGPREERKKKRPGKRSSVEHFTPVNIGYVSEDTTPWQVQQPTQPQSPSPKKPSPGRPATTLRRPSYRKSQRHKDGVLV
ncbi:uncharacterized protein [Bemisia tabaci]|uniref:uncharacterized protein n=1 Tax=Bemisia tabaci TaxID=7038 RepID=UPI003B27C376